MKRFVSVLLLLILISTMFASCEYIFLSNVSDPNGKPSSDVTISTSSDASVESSENTDAGISSDESSDSQISEAEQSADVSDSSDTSIESSSPDTSTSSDVSSDGDTTSKPPVVIDPVEAPLPKNITVLGTGADVRAMEIFFYNEAVARNYATKMNEFARLLGDDITLYSMVIPKQCAFFIKDSKKYGYTADHSLNADTTVKNNLNGVTYVNVYGALESHISEEIYTRTDHHWTALGAFYAAEALANAADVPFSPIDQYTLNRRPGYVGSMYTHTKLAQLLNNPEDFLTLVPKYETKKATYYDKNNKYYTTHDVLWSIPDSQRVGWYCTYLANDEFIVDIESAVCQNGRRLLVIKDSYGNALAPLLTSSFEEIVFVDIRYANVNILDLIEENQITDVAVALSATCAFSYPIMNRLATLANFGK